MSRPSMSSLAEGSLTKPIFFNFRAEDVCAEGPAEEDWLANSGTFVGRGSWRSSIKPFETRKSVPHEVLAGE